MRAVAQLVVTLLLAASVGASQAYRGTHSSDSRPANVGATPGPVGFEHCGSLFPKGRAFGADRFEARWRTVELCSDNFAVVHSGLTKTPLLVVERMNRAVLESALAEQRVEVFYPDDRLRRGERSELQDYAGSGLDRGHLASAASQPGRQAMVQSFALSNIVPQDATSNRRGAWLKVEKDTRRFARRAVGDVFVFSGPLFQGPLRTIGRNEVWVPSHLFKLVYDESGRRAWAHIVENKETGVIGRPMNYQEFVNVTGLDLLAGQVR